MTPPVRRRSLGEIFGQRDSVPPRRPLGEIMQGDEPDEPEGYGRLGGMIMTAADAATFGVGTTAGAGLAAVARKIGGDERPLGDVFRSERDEVRGKLSQFAEEYPWTSLGTNIAGAIASPASRVLNAVTPFKGLGVGARALNAGTQGAIASGVSGAATAPTLDDVPGRVAQQALGGFVAGGALSAAGDVAKQGFRLFGAGPQAPAGTAGAKGIIRRGIGRARDAVGAETAEESGARRVLRLAEQTGRSVDDLAQEINTAAPDDPSMLFERFGTKGPQRLRSFRSIGSTARNEVDETLLDRARNETANLRATLARLTGTPRADAKEVAEEALQRVKPVTDELYASASPATLGGDAAQVARVVQELDNDGFGVWKLARKLGGMPESLGAPPSRTPALDAIEESAESARRAFEEASEASAQLQGYGKLWEDVDAANLRTRSPNLTPAMRRKNTINRKRPGAEVLNRAERRELGYDMTEDARALIEDAGFSPEEFRDMVQRGQAAEQRLPKLRDRLNAAEEALQKAVTASGGSPPPDLTVGQALKVRQALDAMIDDSAERSADRIVQARLVEARAAVDRLVKRAGGNASAAQAVQEADALFTDAKRIGESFGVGVRAAQSGDKEVAARMLRGASKPESARAGLGNELQRRLGGVVDEGGLQNPGPRLTGGDERRAITRMAFPDDASFGEFREAANKITRRIGNMRTATAGSATSDNLIDAMGEFADPQAIASALSGSPTSTLAKLLNMGVVRRVFDANAREADAAVKYMLAGGTGQMTEREAIATLQRLAPAIRARAAQSATRSGLTGAGLAAGVNPSPIRRRENR